jgi:Proteasome subunit
MMLCFSGFDSSRMPSLIAACYKGGVVIGADSRTSMGSYNANRFADKLQQVDNHIYSYTDQDHQQVSCPCEHEVLKHKI